MHITVSAMDAPNEQRWIVEATEAGARVDTFIARKLRIGRRQARRLFERGMVLRGGRPEASKDKSHLLGTGEVIELLGGPVDRVIPEPQSPLRILKQGPGWIAVDKPPGQAVHPLRPGETGTVLNAVAGRFEKLEEIGEGGLRGGVVHRLDVETSGVLLIATQPATWNELREAFKLHKAEKIYYALMAGSPPKSGREQMMLYVARHRPAVVKVAEQGTNVRARGGRHCDLQWRVLEQFAGSALVEVRLGTGFLHQIRVMFAHMGFAVLGDATYGRPVENLGRQMLHAGRLRVGNIEAQSPLPEDFVTAMCAQAGREDFTANLP